ncbi:alkyl hydroperoxide reductase [Actinomadura soli]|uniref:Alkyl hydroperoxide reductase AhpD n=2 Tax=Actinomadura soli TaxID=2508997 RepID=A0A5C4J0G8_9ACTN|nr:alkyl hydroperoxide reductase [Actinomadura soli]
MTPTRSGPTSGPRTALTSSTSRSSSVRTASARRATRCALPGGHLPAEAFEAAKGAASVMAMNNVYYRATHLIGDGTYATLPARLRMSIIGRPGVEKVDFELWCLAVSAVNGCGRCLESHERVVREAGLSRELVQEALRIAAVVNAVAATLDAEAALAPATV